MLTSPADPDAIGIAGYDRGMARSSHRRFVNYIDRSRDYYAAQGYDVPYGWATGNPVPFTPPTGAVHDATVALVTTAAAAPDQERRFHSASSSIIPERMGTDHLSWHKTATTTDDVGSFFPLDALTQLADSGEIASVGANYYSVPTLYSHRRTTKNAEELAGLLGNDGVNRVVLAGL